MKTSYFVTTLGLLAGFSGLLAAGCEETVADVTNSQSDAVTAAVDAACDRYEECGKIGTGRTYETRESCDNQVKDFWNDHWTVADCEGHINGAALTVCTDKIAATECDSFVDKLETVYDSCASDDVCR